MTTHLRSRADLTYEEIVADVRRQLPQTCPHCGSRAIQPLYWVDVEDVWDCSLCFAIFCGRD